MSDAKNRSDQAKEVEQNGQDAQEMEQKNQKQSVKMIQHDSKQGVSQGVDKTSVGFSYWLYILIGLILFGTLMVLFTENVLSPGISLTRNFKQEKQIEQSPALDQVVNGYDENKEELQKGSPTVPDSSIRLDQLIFGLLGFSLLVVMILPFKEKKPPSNEKEEYIKGSINDLINMLDSKTYDQQWKVGYAIAKLVELRQKLGLAPGAEAEEQSKKDDV